MERDTTKISFWSLMALPWMITVIFEAVHMCPYVFCVFSIDTYLESQKKS